MPQPDLFIPRKTQDPIKQPDYGTDMRAIEIWAKGLTSGNSVGGFGFAMGAPSAGAASFWNSGAQSFNGTTQPQFVYPVFGGPIGFPPANFFTSTIAFATFGGGFIYAPSAAGAKIITGVVTLRAPQFTGPTSTVIASISLTAQSLTGVAPAANSLIVTSHTIVLTTGASHTLGAADYNTPTINGADLTFVTGNIRSTAGTTQYVVGWDVIIQWDTANTYEHP